MIMRSKSPLNILPSRRSQDFILIETICSTTLTFADDYLCATTGEEEGMGIAAPFVILGSAAIFLIIFQRRFATIQSGGSQQMLSKRYPPVQKESTCVEDTRPHRTYTTKDGAAHQFDALELPLVSCAEDLREHHMILRSESVRVAL